MKDAHLKLTVLGCALILAAVSASANESDDEPRERQSTKYLISSWGDVAFVYGPGTDPAMDSEAAMENMFRHWKARGFTGIFLRTDLAQIPPGKLIRHPATTQPDAPLANIWHLIDEILERSDPHVAAAKAARNVGFEHWMFHPYIYSEGAPADAGIPGPGRMVPWSYMRRYHAEHPEVITVDRQGNKQWMVPEYAYPGVRAEKVAEFVYMAQKYRPTGILASMRSEASQLLPPPEHADQYGFNQPIVDEMKRLYDVDILTDPRFDYKSPSFKSDDPMVQNWRVLRGTYVTQLYREIHQAIKAVDPNIQFAVTLSGEYVGPVLGNWKLDWRTWVDEGIVDVIVAPVTFEATLDLEAHTKGYLTDTRAGTGTVSARTISKYIAKSAHPSIRVIHSSAPSYFYPPPPPGSDGWQCDAWYDLYTLAFYQRWERQCLKDVADFGHIKFFEQNFDTFPAGNTGASGSHGDGRHNPDLRATPGVWYRFGDGADGKAIIQSQVRRGDSGHAVLLKTEELYSRHHSTPDRSRVTGMLDVAITNGVATFEFWLNRDNPNSGVTACLTSDSHSEKDVGVRIDPGSGQIRYASGNQWVGSDVHVPPNQWRQICIELNADAQTYSAFAGPDKAQICRDVKYAPAKERFVSQHGINVPIKVPSYRSFNVLYFLPSKSEENRVYLDDVLVKWTPTLHYAAPGTRVVLNENFEDQTPGAPLSPTTADARWIIKPASEHVQPLVENTTSYGEGTRCLRAYGGATITAAPSQELSMASAGATITLDLDMFVRSDKNFAYIIPDPTTRSPHSAEICLIGNTTDQPLAALRTAGGTWQLWDGDKFVDTGKVVTYDVWQHLQIAIDTETRAYRLVVQPLGELPSIIGQAAVGSSVKPVENFRLRLITSSTRGHTSCYDNIRLTGE